MTVSRQRFEQGLTYAAYKAQMTRNRERMDENEQLATLYPADVAFFRNLPAKYHLLILAEDWCGDVINNLPVIARMAEESGKLDLRIFLRDQNLDIMDQYLKEGKYRSIPVVVVFDQYFHELGYWIERPAHISELHAAMIEHLYAYDPAFEGVTRGTSPGELPEAARARMIQAFAQFRAEHRDLADQLVISDLRAIISRHLSISASQSASAESTFASIAGPGNLADLKRRAEAAQHRSGRQVKVSITYCAVCGYEPQTLALVQRLMLEFIYDLSAIELIPWQDGAFDVAIDGELVHSMYRDGGFPEHEAIVHAVREKLA